MYIWKLAIPMRIETGTYDVFAAAADDKGEDGGISGNWLFVVADPGGCKR